MKKICVVTGSRAEYGLLYWLLKRLEGDPAIRLQLVATGAHLSRRHGFTVREIERDGFRLSAKVPILNGDDSAFGVTRALARAVSGFAAAFDRLKPDCLVVLGDRYEALAAAQAALLARMPVAHIAGGDLTEGAVDDAMRHAITKMSHLHFVTNAPAALRARQLGERRERIVAVGSPGLDWIRRTALLGRREFEQAAGFSLRKRNLLVTFHPETLSAMAPEAQMKELLKALDRLGRETGLLFTAPNADAGGLRMAHLLKRFVRERRHAKLFASMGHRLYLSAMRHVDAVVGNSSSGLYEAPSFKIPTVNIGDRQKGRIKASSVIDCKMRARDIVHVIRAAYRRDCSRAKNPYGDGRSSERIFRRLKRIRDYRALLKKTFWTLPEARNGR